MAKKKRMRKEDAKKYTTVESFTFWGSDAIFFFTDTLCPGIPIGTVNDMGCTESSLFGGRLELYCSRGKWGHKTIKGLLALLAKSLSSLVVCERGKLSLQRVQCSIAVFTETVVTLSM